MRFLICSILATGLLAAMNTGHISGPALAYAKRDKALKTLIGVPGAAYFGRDVDIAGLELAAFSSQAAYAVLLTPDRKSVRIIRPATGSVPVETVAETRTPVHNVRLSPSGSAAALVHDDGIDIIAGLPTQPVAKTRIAKSWDIRLIAVADDGEAVAIVEESGAAWLVERSDKRQIAATDIRDIEFRSASHDYIYADGDVVAIASSAGSTIIAGPSDGIYSPLTARLSPTSAFAAVINGNAQELLIRPSSGGIPGRVALPCEASDLEWLRDATLRISCQHTGSVHLLRATDSDLRLFFVPEPVE